MAGGRATQFQELPAATGPRGGRPGRRCPGMMETPARSASLQAVISGRPVGVLDGLRGFAVLYVVLYHFMPAFPGSVVGDAVTVFFRMGWSGVDLFFVLSGFLITGVLYRTKDGPSYFRHFYARRFLRIFPIYYLFVFLSVCILPGLGPRFPVVENSHWYWLYLSNLDTELGIPFHPYLCVAWSLSIEEQYYLVYPTLVRFLDYRRWIGLLVGLVLLSVVLRGVFYFGFNYPSINVYHFTLTHFDGIAIGGLIRLLVMKADQNRLLLQALVRWTLPCAVAMVTVAAFCFHDIRRNSLGPHLSFHPVMFLCGYLLNAVFYAQVLLRCILHEGLLYRLFNAAWLRHLGKYSYAMYLWQFPARGRGRFPDAPRRPGPGPGPAATGLGRVGLPGPVGI